MEGLTEETWKRMQDDFVAADRKEDFIIPAAALQAGLKPEDVEKYMTAKLDEKQLLEQTAAIMDGLPKPTLSQFANGSISAEDMRVLRLNSRSDSLVEIMLQEIRNLNETMMDLDYGREIEGLSKAMKDMRKELIQMKAELSGLQKKHPEGEITETIQDIQQMEAEEQQREGTVPDTEPEERAGLNMKTDIPVQPLVQPEGYIDMERGIIIERRKQSGKSNGLLSFFRRMNADKIEKNEEQKRLSVMEFVKQGLDDEKLEAVSEAVRFGVPYEHLKYIIDKEGNAGKIRKLTEIYLYLFSGSQEAVTA